MEKEVDKMINRTKFRVYLLSLVLNAIVVGIFYYSYVVQKESIITEGTFVENIAEGCRNLCL